MPAIIMGDKGSVVARRCRNNAVEARFTYYFASSPASVSPFILYGDDSERDHGHTEGTAADGQLFLRLLEDSRKVDGIGGVTWDGSLLMSRLLERLLLLPPAHAPPRPHQPRHRHLLEVGCGGGLCSIVAAHTSGGWSCTATDQEADLARANIALLAHSSSVCARLAALPLSWGAAGPEEASLLAQRGGPDVLVGCEVACLRSQQERLVRSLRRLAAPQTVLLLSLDEPPPPNTNSAERDLDRRLADEGFSKEVLSAGRVVWAAATTTPDRGEEGDIVATSTAYLHDLTSLYAHNTRRFSLPGFVVEGSAVLRGPSSSQDGQDNGAWCANCRLYSAFDLTGSAHAESAATLRPGGGGCEDGEGSPEQFHHIALYYREAAVSLCPCCGHGFFPSLN